MYLDSMSDHGQNADMKFQAPDSVNTEHASSYEVLRPQVPVIQINQQQSRTK